MLIKYHQLKEILQYFFALEFWREPLATTKKKKQRQNDKKVQIMRLCYAQQMPLLRIYLIKLSN